ncbi:hypothetical protein [Rhizobium terrae]|uniref:hypothetical protein n=1 Tax=Rhizobium terrae TaxID=2171756 RepID=UPI000E3D444E|nr:hypothetical protein [Rhizobium terrae]
MKTAFAFAALLAASGFTVAHASSDDAWSGFRAEVSKACIAAAKGLIQNGKALVDPFGSENYGLAVVSGRAAGAKATVSTICVFDKKTKKAEIGGEISAGELLVKTGK